VNLTVDDQTLVILKSKLSVSAMEALKAENIALKREIQERVLEIAELHRFAYSVG